MRSHAIIARTSGRHVYGDPAAPTLEPIVEMGQIDGMGQKELESVMAQMHDSVTAVVSQYKDAEGKTDWTKIKGAEAEHLQDMNLKMAAARQRIEAAMKLSSVTEHERFMEYMKMPAGTPHLHGAPNPVKQATSLGRAFTDSEAYKSFRKGTKGFESQIGYVVKDAQGKATLGTDDALTDVDSDYEPEVTRTGDLVEVLYQAQNIGPLMANITTNQNSIEYMVETVTSQGAVETAEGALATEADISYEPATEVIRKIPVLLPITEELLADVPAIRGIVNSRLITFVGNREDLQILKGDGTGQNIEGIINRTGVQTQNYSVGGGTAQDLLEDVHGLATLVRQAFLTPGTAVMNAGTWQFLRLAKDSQNNYLLGPALTAGVQRLWGLPVLMNEHMDDHDSASNNPILVGDWGQGASVFRRLGITVSVSDSHDDNFARGILTVRAVSRLGLVVWRPSAFAMVATVA